MPLQYKRITLVVADIDRSLTIYQDILGFTTNYIKDSANDSYSYPVFNIPKGAKIRFGAFDSPTQERTLGLTEVKGCPLPKNDGIRMHASVIQVDDLATKMKKIKKLGLETTEPFIDSNEYARFIEQSFIDFDGHLVVLYELFPN